MKLECHLSSYMNAKYKLSYVSDSYAVWRIFQNIILKPSVIKDYIIELCQNEDTKIWKI